MTAGIQPEVMPSFSIPFHHQASTARHGFGSAVACSIVREHGGNIEA